MWDKSKIIALASDHAGFELKSYILKTLEKEGYKFNDFGTYNNNSVDYPDFAHKAGKAVNDGTYERGIVICGSGNGVNMTVNKYANVRGALCWNAEQALLTRKHNDANIIALPGRFIDFDEAINAVITFLNTDFEGGRHELRIQKIPIR
ncbi:MAG: ribose 5-phosphate isomerase B [Lentimicrobium sp.]|jgi:ribose 5-phosphate isomerase B|nr:ribose 5-phosphate isomerase B [Lentimicrobium sp.]MDD2528733.1 ribose 5-phosphate isomerase B [Lentimicrobiaceae bacterium]MDD4599161.1 ribose 5-phosphate isomerase B [Lentimicrobiaceae bacterium]MDY0025341.1 ribose 5-phosphate isomerase B [Lentimicrobium sp.]HAH57061.1 ribose 5-phosphate isomerase B [Bacteroidales bacterium]